MRLKIFVFAGIFCAVFVIHSVFRTYHPFLDPNLWTTRVDALTETLKHGTAPDQTIFSEHPGTPVLMLASGINILGASSSQSLIYAVALFVAACATGIYIVIYVFGKSLPWATVALAATTLHPLYFASSPVDATFSPLVSLIVIMACFLVKPWHSRRFIVLWMCLLGVTLATRFHITIALSVVPSLMLVEHRRTAFAVILAAGSLAVAIFLTPLMWYTPAVFLRALTAQVGFLQDVNTPTLSVDSIVLVSSLALLSFCLAVTLRLLRFNIQPFSRSYLRAITVTTVFTVALIGISRLQSPRYLYPIIMAWEVLLFGFAVTLLLISNIPRKILYAYILAGILVFFYVIMFVYMLVY